jgi:hypothetical protein
LTPPVAFYCISSDLYFPGAVALVNSLRLVGHTEPIFLLDCGLSDAHRELIATEVTIVETPAESAPHLLKTIAPTSHPAQTMVLIDVDMIATRPLTQLIEAAASGRVVAVKDNLDRFVPEWGDLLDLGAIRRQPYVSSGLVALGGAVGNEVLRLWDSRRHRVDYEQSWFERDVAGYPFRFIDQDVLNAVLGTIAEDELVVESARAAPHQPYRGLRIVDQATLECAYEDGSQPFVLHQYLGKPWVSPMYHGIYSQLMRRLWLGDDVAIAFPADEVPSRMRRGRLASVERKLVDVGDLARWYVRDVIPEWARSRFEGSRAGGRT